INLLASFGPFNEHGQIVALLSQRFDQIAILFKTPATLQDSLGLGLIFPEVWRSGARFQSGKFFLRAGSLKDSSAGRQLACSSLRSGASTRRDSTCSPVPLSQPIIVHGDICEPTHHHGPLETASSTLPRHLSPKAITGINTTRGLPGHFVIDNGDVAL